MQAFIDVKRQNLETFKRIIEEGQNAGIFVKNLNIPLIPATIMGVIVHFQMNRQYFEPILGLDNDEKYELYIENELTAHIKQTIKALLVHEN